MPPTTVTTKAFGDDRQIHARIGGDARDLECAAETGEERAEKQRSGEEHRLIDAERRHHVAILRRGADQDAEAGLSQQQPYETEHDGPGGDQHQFVGRENAVREFPPERAGPARGAREYPAGRRPG